VIVGLGIAEGVVVGEGLGGLAGLGFNWRKTKSFLVTVLPGLGSDETTKLLSKSPEPTDVYFPSTSAELRVITALARVFPRRPEGKYP
jgi:hypothetical protein